MKILLFSIFIISSAYASLEQCGIETSSDNFNTFQSCESKKSVRQKVTCYDSINKKIKKEMKKKSVYELSPSLGNLLTEVRKSFELNMNPKRKITYYEALELFRTANECQNDVVSLHEYNKELDQHEVIKRSCIFSSDQKKKSLQAAKEVMTNHYIFFNSGQRLNDLKKLLSPPEPASHRTEPDPLAMQDCRAGMLPGPYPPQSFTKNKRSKRKDKMNCPAWVQEMQTCGKKDEFDLSAPTLFQDMFNLGVELQLKAYSENLLTANPSKLTSGYKNKVIKKIKGSLGKCFDDGTLDQGAINKILGESLFQKKSIDKNGEITIDKIQPYFSEEGFEEFERFEAIEVAKSVKKLAVMEKYFTKVSKKLSLLNKYYQGKCGLSIWFPSWGTQSNDQCDKVKAHIDQFADAVINPIKEQISAERNRFPFLSIPLSGGEFGSSTCFTGVVEDVIDDPLSYVMYGKLSGAVKYQQFSSASKNVHYDMACAKPLWKGASDKNLYKTKLDNFALAEKRQDDYDELFKLIPAKGFNDRPQFPNTSKVHDIIDEELSSTNLFSEINQFKTFMNNLQNQPPPDENEIALTAKLKREADKGLEEALTGSLQEACKNPQDYGKELLANDTIGKMYFSSNERSESDMQLYCKERSEFIAQSKMTERNLSDASLGIGMLGFLHPIAAVAVLPVEFGLEYAQYKEATSDKKRNLSLALFGLEDYAKADEEISTLKSEELMFYGVIGAMALGGLGDIADTFGGVAKYGRYSSRANSITKDISTKGADHLKDFQRQIVALENSGLNDIQKRIEILENWKQLKRDLSPEDFLKLEKAFGDKISSIKNLLARDIKFDLVREFAKSDLVMFIDDIEKLSSPAELDTLIKAYRKAKTSDEHFSEFIALLRRRGDSCGI